MADNNNYSASNIQHLEGLEHIRLRPGMYIGTTSKTGLHHMAWEIIDNSVDEHMAGFCSHIEVTITKDNHLIVKDDGRGIPVDIHPHFNISALEVVLTQTNAGGKFNKDSYAYSGGLHGVGSSAVNALSDLMIATVRRDGKIYQAKFADGGKITQHTKIIGETDLNDTGTTIEFHPDFSIMEPNVFDKEVIIDHAKQIAHLNKGLSVSVRDLRDNTYEEFIFENGIIDYVNELNEGLKPLEDEVEYISQEYIASTSDGAKEDGTRMLVEIAFQYVSDFYRPNIISYTNNISTHEGGTHVAGLYDSLIRIINNYAIENNIVKNESEKFSRDDVIEGLTAIISIKHPNPQFEGQTKAKLGSKDARTAVNRIFSEYFERQMAENPEYAKKLIEKAQQARKSRLASNAARDNARRKSAFDNGGLPGKLADCSSKNAEISELFIVEGNSAGGSAKMGRDRNTQAILPLRGKVLNVEKARQEKVLENEEIMSLVTALGTGMGDNFNINKLRYHKIVIMTDADVDGAHIRTLLLTFFYRYFRELIEYGFIFIAQPPLYKISHGKTIHYAYTDEQKDKILSTLNPNIKFNIQRYKGLGEMDADQLWETTMNPENRNLLQVQVEDAYKADWAFSTLMGEKVEPRREFIEKNAKFVKNLDI
ncbi:DNA topoisomerase subunit B [Mycoplasmopsis ciconiae]|uniref:DNA gyrase subunit B n=1 Tax=Mycoplasmopsis ciconiae TaxID=561067 RepID=A0ABU7MMW8_9BACT|nr:DNA topoisomerase subunit B [Mycoplasmopsis ciconiae]